MDWIRKILSKVNKYAVFVVCLLIVVAVAITSCQGLVNNNGDNNSVALMESSCITQTDI